MDLKNNTVEQREYLERNLEQLNAVVGATLDIKINLRIEKCMNYKMEEYFKIIDDTNIRDHCGVMAKAFKEVIINSFGVWWREDGVTIELDFEYEHINGGHNGAKFCTVEIIDGIVKIR